VTEGEYKLFQKAMSEQGLSKSSDAAVLFPIPLAHMAHRLTGLEILHTRITN
jgi:hypothetical protein